MNANCIKITDNISKKLKNSHLTATIIYENDSDLVLFPMNKFVFCFLVENDFEFVQVGFLERIRNTDKYHIAINLGVRKSKFEAEEIFDMIQVVQEQLKDETSEEHELREFENPRAVIEKYVKQKQ